MLDARAEEILLHLVDVYLETRAPVGSVALAKRLGMQLSPATVRSVMADLENASLLTSPHTSAGRIPTDTGLRFVAQHFLEVRHPQPEDRKLMEEGAQTPHRSLQGVLEDVTERLAGLSACAGVITAPQPEDMGLKHIEFLPLQPGRALVILVHTSGKVENRIIELVSGIMPFHLQTASNYLNSWLKRQGLREATQLLRKSLDSDKAQIDHLSRTLVEKGIELWSSKHQNNAPDAPQPQVLIRGYANLVRHVDCAEELQVLEDLLCALDHKEGLIELLGMVEKAQSVQLFIGADNVLFASNQCSAVLAPYKGADGQVVGAVGVVGPSYMNYRRIVPVVDYTAHLLAQKISKKD